MMTSFEKEVKLKVAEGKIKLKKKKLKGTEETGICDLSVCFSNFKLFKCDYDFVL